MNRRKWTLSEKVLLLSPLLFVLVGATALLPDGSRMFPATLETLGIMTREAGNQRSCQSNLKQISLGVMQYLQDYDEKYPLVAAGGFDYGWADEIVPYAVAFTDMSIYHCPKFGGSIGTNPRATGYTDYFYNARLSGRKDQKVAQPALTILFGEGISSDARYAKTQLPPEWITDPKSPAYRHFQPKSATVSGANYAFADGHVKWLQPQKIGVAPVAKGGYTFSIR